MHHERPVWADASIVIGAIVLMLGVLSLFFSAWHAADNRTAHINSGKIEQAWSQSTEPTR